MLAFIREIENTKSQHTQYRVFLNHPKLSQDVDVSNPHYVASFGFFEEQEGHGGHDSAPSIVVDLTATIQRVFGNMPTTPDLLRVQILPVPEGKVAVAEVGTAKPAAVEVAFI